MKLNWKPSRVAFIDFETRSDVDLDTVHKFATHPSTQALTCVVKTDDGCVRKYGPFLSAQAKDELAHIAKHHTMVAHNAPFDAAVWERCAGLPEAEWFDTLPCARAAGMPGALDALSKIVTGRGKDPNGKKLVSMLCLPQRAYPPLDSPAYALLMQYNLRDVEELEQVYHRVKGFTEPAVMTVDRIINDRGVPMDGEHLRALKELYARNKEESGSAFDELTGGVNPNSPKQVVEWLHRSGFDVPSISKHAWSSFLAEPEAAFVGDGDLDASVEAVVEAMRLRKEVARVGGGKVGAALSVLDSDGRAREQHVYWGAHTGRWSGRKLQIHNMPISVQGVDTLRMELTWDAVSAEAERASLELGRRVSVADLLSSAIRHAVRALALSVADYSAIEARCTAWLAGCTRMLRIFADPSQSVYCDFGKQLFGREITKKADYDAYNISKTLVLGCGYGMSGKKFAWTCNSRGHSTAALEEAGFDVAETVRVFRETYHELPALWKAYDAAIKLAVAGVPSEAGRCKFYARGPDMHIELPSGRCIVYRNARVEMLVPAYCALYGMPLTPVPTVVYDSPRGYRGFLYGSKVCLGADTEVVTSRGIVRVQDVEPGDLVWDGEEWVETDGSVCNGTQEVGEVLGVLATPDHEFFNGERWMRASSIDNEIAREVLQWAQAKRVCAKTVVARRQQKVQRGALAVTSLEFSRDQGRTGENSIGTTLSTQLGCAGSCVQRSGGARNHRTMLTKTTAVEVCECISRGSTIQSCSSSTSRRSKVGTIRRLNLTELTTPGTTNRATSDSLRDQSTRITAGAQCSLGIVSKSTRCRNCGGLRSGTSLLAPSMRTLKQVGWRELRCLAKVYDLVNCGPRHRFTILTPYGPAVVSNCENVSQAVCRDVLAEALVNSESAGLNPVLHVHDEEGAETDRLEELLEIMSTPPTWAPGFPLLVEGYVGDVWTKLTKNYRELSALNGRVL